MLTLYIIQPNMTTAHEMKIYKYLKLRTILTLKKVHDYHHISVQIIGILNLYNYKRIIRLTNKYL